MPRFVPAPCWEDNKDSLEVHNHMEHLPESDKHLAEMHTYSEASYMHSTGSHNFEGMDYDPSEGSNAVREGDSTQGQDCTDQVADIHIAAESNC